MIDYACPITLSLTPDSGDVYATVYIMERPGPSSQVHRFPKLLTDFRTPKEALQYYERMLLDKGVRLHEGPPMPLRGRSEVHRVAVPIETP